MTKSLVAKNKDVLFAASRLSGSGEFNTARVIRILATYGMVVRAWDVASHIEGVLTGSGLYYTNEVGVFVAA